MGFLSQAVTLMPARSSILMRGVLDTPMPMTATRLPFSPARYSCMVERLITVPPFS